jgi:hypothetical protein
MVLTQRDSENDSGKSPMSAAAIIARRPLSFLPAETENNQTVRAEFENLAEAFLRVAEQADRDAAFAAETELPSPKPRR